MIFLNGLNQLLVLEQSIISNKGDIKMKRKETTVRIWLSMHINPFWAALKKNRHFFTWE
jgi:hypothetical protein